MKNTDKQAQENINVADLAKALTVKSKVRAGATKCNICGLSSPGGSGKS
jgi:hypothetical protein